MSEQSYLLKISLYQAEIDDCQDKICALKQELSDAEESLHEARKYSTKFYNALDIKKNKRNELSMSNCLKAIVSWTNQLDDLLNGSKFKKADNNIQTLISKIKAEIRRLSEELDYYEDKLETAERNLDNAYEDLKDYRRAEAERMEAERKEFAKLQQQALHSQNNNTKSNGKTNDMLDNLTKFFKK